MLCSHLSSWNSAAYQSKFPTYFIIVIYKMEPSPSPSTSLLSSPFSPTSPKLSALLKIKILSWTQETGFPVSIRVRIADSTFNLHKVPLTCKSGYFREKLRESNEVELPPDFPGGAETFQMIALFIYGSSTLVHPFNVPALRCAAEFLRTGSLCERFDVYLNRVILQNWDDTLIVLQKCQTLLPWAEDVLMVSRCIETLAFMACMEILDPERRRDHPVVTLEALSRRRWSDATVKDIVAKDSWIKDLTALPFAFFKRVIGSLRRQGMKEKFVCPIVLVYAHRWVIASGSVCDDAVDSSVLVQGVVDLLPVGVKLPVPIAFYLSLLSTSSVRLHLTSDRLDQLQNQIASMLHLAHLQDFLSVDLLLMESIFSKYLDSNNYTYVAQLWDTYLNEIADNSELSCTRFINLIQTLPISCRQTHDHLYRALDTFLQSHPDLSQQEKGMVCKYLNCSKLSQQVCIEAVQNEAMPLRLIVQALFVQQLNTQQAFKECSDSFRCGGGESSELTMSCSTDQTGADSSDYESTSFRIQNLEKQLMSLKRSLKVETKIGCRVETRVMSKQVRRSCIGGTLCFSSHRKYANTILKLLQKVTLRFGRSKRKPAPGVV